MNEDIYNKWLNAQKHEIFHHQKQFNPSLDDSNSKFYFGLYDGYFKLLGLDYDLNGQSVVEIGPAKIAGLCFCKNYGKSYIIEPLVFQDTIDFYNSKDITVINEPAETCNIPKVNQIWLFNVLQHVIDPLAIIENCKKSADVIYFFEPINYPTDDLHIHRLSTELFKKGFDDNCVKIYKGNSMNNFHTADCAYGKYVCNKNNTI